jgi:hypothetical protein
MTLANIVARMERSEIRDSRDGGPGLRGACHRAALCADPLAPSGLQPLYRVVICPSGGVSTGVSSLISDFPKNISVPIHPKSILELFASHPTEGRIAIVTDAGWDAVDAAALGVKRGLQGGLAKGL